MKLTKCFGCGTDNPCIPEPHTKEEKQQLIDVINKWGSYLFYYNFCEPSLCDVKSSLAKFNLPKFKELERYLPAINKIFSESDERLMISEQGMLSWYWEDDSDYGASSGIMDFQYSKQDAGQTWAYSEIVATIRNMSAIESDEEWDNFTIPVNIKSDLDLLQYITNRFIKCPHNNINQEYGCDECLDCGIRNY